MFPMIKWSQISLNSFVRISSQSKSSINMTTIRWKRNTFHRRPIKILTDSGEDYHKHTSYEEPISSVEREINLNDLRKHESLNQYFDEGFNDGFNEEIVDKNNRNKFRERNQRIDKQFNRQIDDNRRDLINHNRNSERNNEDFKAKNDENRKQMNTNEKKSFMKREKSCKELKPRIDGIPVYEKLGENNREFISVLSQMKMRKRREKQNMMSLEGKRLICDAIDAGIKLKTIYFTKEENLVGIPNLSQMTSNGLELKKVFYNDMKLFSEVVTSPGVMAVCERPDYNNYPLNPIYNDQKMPLILIGDNIRDPGNLGTMIRCAAAVGIEKIILTKGCVDAWDSKVLRSGAGAHFRVPIVNDIEWPLVFNHIPINKPFDLFIADSNKEFERNPINKNKVKPITENAIPMHTINTIERDLETDESILRDNSYDDTNNNLFKYRTTSIASNIYSDTKFFTLGTERPSILVIGGETHGLSNQSYKLAYDYIGRRVKIPLEFGVDSLNSAVAAAVILYEMKRQFQFNCSKTVNENIEQVI